MKWRRANKEYEEYLLKDVKEVYRNVPDGWGRVERFYLEVDQESGRRCLYPLLNIIVCTDVLQGYGGFTVQAYRKSSEEGWWHECGIPEELSVEVAEIIGEYVKRSGDE